MEFELPCYAVQRLANGYWLIRAPTGDPVGPRYAMLPRPNRRERLGGQLWRCTDARIGSRIFPAFDLKEAGRASPMENFGGHKWRV